MKKLFILMLLSGVSYFTQAQSAACDKSACCDKSVCCDKKTCCEGSKTCDASAINTMRSDLQTVIAKMSKSSVSFNKDIVEMEITKASTDDECLRNLCQVASAVRSELVNKVDPSKLNASLKNYKPSNSSKKEKMVSGLKKEIELLTAQVAML